MKSLKDSFLALFFLFITVSVISLKAQSSEAVLTEYLQFLESHQNMTTEQLLQMHPAGDFSSSVNYSWESALFSDSIESQLDLTQYEKELLNRHGFVVTERLRKGSFVEQFLQVWIKDLPVYISSDAILHAFHFYYDKMLMKTEEGFLIEHLKKLLDEIHDNIPKFADQYGSIPEMNAMLRDVDVYLTVPLKLLGESVNPFYSENNQTVNELLGLINAEQLAEYPLFSSHDKLIDFSQFKPRGHYTESVLLQKYFRAMMWLGRIELYLIAPDNALSNQTPQDIQRQVIDAVLVSELIERTDADIY